MEQTETILIAPLNWGLGHATRCVPVIQQFVAQKARVILAGEGASLLFLKQEFPELESISLPGLNISYFRGKSLFFGLILQMPLFVLSILREHASLKKIVRAYSINRVISDNRYGLWSKHTRNVLITHQLFIQLPRGLAFLKGPLHRVTRYLIEKFDECWIPDFENPEQSLSGALSHGKKIPSNARYIGPLSRFQNYKLPETFTEPFEKPDVLVLISGPEPFRSAFQKDMEAKHKHSTQRVLLVCGVPGKKPDEASLTLKPGVTKVSHLATPYIYFFLKESSTLISLAGYSTLMDLFALGKTATLIPTPGQTEQQYLVSWHQKKMAAQKAAKF